MHARAFTIGRDVFFNRGEFQPGASCAVTSVVRGIGAIADQAWMEDDPEAVQLWAAGKLGPNRSALKNPAANRVRLRLWRRALRHIRLLGILECPPIRDPKELQTALLEFQERELLLPPEYRLLES